jgi:hypothetical protein
MFHTPPLSFKIRACLNNFLSNFQAAAVEPDPVAAPTQATQPANKAAKRSAPKAKVEQPKVVAEEVGGVGGDAAVGTPAKQKRKRAPPKPKQQAQPPVNVAEDAKRAAEGEKAEGADVGKQTKQATVRSKLSFAHSQTHLHALTRHTLIKATHQLTHTHTHTRARAHAHTHGFACAHKA